MSDDHDDGEEEEDEELSADDDDGEFVRRKFFHQTLKPGEFMYEGPDLRLGDLVRHTLGNKSTEGHIVRIERMSDGATFKHPKCLIRLENGETLLILAENLMFVERRPAYLNWEEDDEEGDWIL